MGIFKKTATWTERLESYRQRIANAQSELTALSEEREGLALSAVDGDQKAKARIAEIDSLRTAAERSIADLRTAERTAESAIADEQAEAARLEALARVKRIREAADVVLAIDKDVDAALAALAAGLQKRFEAARVLQAAMAPEQQISNRIYGKDHITRAVRHFGLHEFFHVAHVSQAHNAPLSVSDQSIIGGGEKNEEAA